MESIIEEKKINTRMEEEEKEGKDEKEIMNLVKINPLFGGHNQHRMSETQNYSLPQQTSNDERN